MAFKMERYPIHFCWNQYLKKSEWAILWVASMYDRVGTQSVEVFRSSVPCRESGSVVSFLSSGLSWQHIQRHECKYNSKFQVAKVRCLFNQTHMEQNMAFVCWNRQQWGKACRHYKSHFQSTRTKYANCSKNMKADEIDNNMFSIPSQMRAV